MEQPLYIQWLVKEHQVTFEDGVPLDCFRLDYQIDDVILDNWALHIRRHYVSDQELHEDAEMWEMTEEEYLRQFVVPQRGEAFGPTARSNDISEILFADLLEYVMGYSVPRCKQHNRSGKNESEHGTDVIGYKFYRPDKNPHNNDELITIEVKANLTSTSPNNAITSAIIDAHKDEHRFAHTINYYRKKLQFMGKSNEADDIARFQKKTDQDYQITNIAGAMTSQEVIPNNVLVGIKGNDLEIRVNNKVFYVHGKCLMDLAHNVFERCVK